MKQLSMFSEETMAKLTRKKLTTKWVTQFIADNTVRLGSPIPLYHYTHPNTNKLWVISHKSQLEDVEVNGWFARYHDDLQVTVGLHSNFTMYALLIELYNMEKPRIVVKGRG